MTNEQKSAFIAELTEALRTEQLDKLFLPNAAIYVSGQTLALDGYRSLLHRLHEQYRTVPTSIESLVCEGNECAVYYLAKMTNNLSGGSFTQKTMMFLSLTEANEKIAISRAVIQSETPRS